MTRRLALILGFFCMLLAILACNLPTEIDPKTYTQTAVFAASATGVSNLTSTANALASYLTQTAFAPPTETDTPEAPAPTLVVPGNFPTLDTSGGSGDSGTSTGNSSSFKVGDIVKVFTTDGSQLRLRDTPSKDGKVVKALANGTKATVLDGPQVVDGATWWKIKVSVTNEVGWCLEFADNIHTLQLVSQ